MNFTLQSFLETDCEVGVVTLLLTEAAASFYNGAAMQSSLAKFGVRLLGGRRSGIL